MSTQILMFYGLRLDDLPVQEVNKKLGIVPPPERLDGRPEEILDGYLYRLKADISLSVGGNSDWPKYFIVAKGSRTAWDCLEVEGRLAQATDKTFSELKRIGDLLGIEPKVWVTSFDFG